MGWVMASSDKSQPRDTEISGILESNPEISLYQRYTSPNLIYSSLKRACKAHLSTEPLIFRTIMMKILKIFLKDIVHHPLCGFLLGRKIDHTKDGSQNFEF